MADSDPTRLFGDQPLAEPAAHATARLAAIASADSVIGSVETQGARTVIPLASVMAAYGFGYGRGDNAEGGGGGGGGAQARPVAVLEITEAGIRVHQVVDTTRITLASLALAGWAVFWITRTVRAFRRR